MKCEWLKFKAEGLERGEGVNDSPPLLMRGVSPPQQLGGWQSAVSSPTGVEGSAPTTSAFWTHLKSPENTSIGHKCCLVFVSRFDSAEPLGLAEPWLKNSDQTMEPSDY